MKSETQIRIEIQTFCKVAGMLENGASAKDVMIFASDLYDEFEECVKTKMEKQNKIFKKLDDTKQAAKDLADVVVKKISLEGMED